MIMDSLIFIVKCYYLLTLPVGLAYLRFAYIVGTPELPSERIAAVKAEINEVPLALRHTIPYIVILLIAFVEMTRVIFNPIAAFRAVKAIVTRDYSKLEGKL